MKWRIILTYLGDRPPYLEEVTAISRRLSVATPTKTDRKPDIDPNGGHSNSMLRRPSGARGMGDCNPVMFTAVKPLVSNFNPDRNKSKWWRSPRSVLILAATLVAGSGNAMADGPDTNRTVTNKTDTDKTESGVEVVSIWNGNVPAWNAPAGNERDISTAQSNQVGGKPLIRLTDVADPQLHVYPANDASGQKNKATTFVIICPGGGFKVLAWDLEGTEIAQWLNSIGVSAGVLKHRVPTRDESVKYQAPVQDVHQAMKIVRQRYLGEGGALGLIGFSAGGQTVVRASVDDDDPPANFTPADFCVLVYPAYLADQKTGEFAGDLDITDSFPPTFFAHAANDGHLSKGSVLLHQMLVDRGIASELHVFATGGHGFGGRVSGQPIDAWRSLCESWMRSQGFLIPKNDSMSKSDREDASDKP